MTRFKHTQVKTADEWRVAAAINGILSQFSDSTIEELHIKRVKGNRAMFTVELSNRYAAQAFFIMFKESLLESGLPIALYRDGHCKVYVCRVGKF